VRERRATLLVIDGLMTAAEMAASEVTLRRFIQELQLYLEAVGCTTVLLSRPTAGRANPEHTMVDGVLELADRHAGAYVERIAEVTKFRGSDYLRGRHSYEITAGGLVLYPRTEAIFGARVPEPAVHTPLQFGLPRLDTMLGGGLGVGSTTLVLGGPGTGKTLLGLHFLASGAAAGEGGLYVGFQEPPSALLARGDRVGINLRDAVARDQVAFHWQPARDQGLDALAASLFDVLTEQGTRRLVIDGLGGFRRAALDPGRLDRFWAALINELRARGVTTVATLEMPEFYGPAAAVPIPGLAELTDTILFLRSVELRSQLYRLLTIMKGREREHDRAIREFRIRDEGIEVAETFASAEAILTGVARPLSLVTDVAAFSTGGVSREEGRDADGADRRG
jgi:circadian clock protein KaiC